MADSSASRPSVQYPAIAADEIGWLDEQQMIEVDRIMIEDLRIELIQMMENAGRNLASLVIDRFAPASVTVLAGSGGNGGGGLVAARHLANRGVDVSVTVAKPASLGPVPAHQFDIVQRMGVEVRDIGAEDGTAGGSSPRSSDVVIDALIGYSLRGAPRGPIGELVSGIGSVAPVVVSLDTPSGLNVTDGSTPGPVVDASATLTLALPKLGLRDAPQVGELYVGDISVPPSAYDRVGVDASLAPPFQLGPIVRCAERS